MNLLSSRETQLFAGHVLPDVFQELRRTYSPRRLCATFHNASVYARRARNRRPRIKIKAATRPPTLDPRALHPPCYSVFPRESLYIDPLLRARVPLLHGTPTWFLPCSRFAPLTMGGRRGLRKWDISWQQGVLSLKVARNCFCVAWVCWFGIEEERVTVNLISGLWIVG